MGTLRLGSFDGDTVVIEADYHDGNQRIQVVRCINNGTENVRATVLDGTEIVAQVTYLPGTTEQNIPQGKTLTVDDLGSPTFPYELRLEYPAP